MMSQTFDDVTNNFKIDDIACNISIDERLKHPLRQRDS